MLRLGALLGLSVGLWAVVPQHQELPGCYAFRTYTWSPRPEASAVMLHTPPDTFRLYATRGSAEAPEEHALESERLLVRPRMAKPSWGGMAAAFWDEQGPDSVRIWWTTGHTGARVVARRVEGTLVGRLDWITDALGGDPKPHADVVLDRIACPAALPEVPVGDTVPAAGRKSLPRP